MTEQEALEKMVAPGHRREGKPLGGVIQIHVTRACNLACFGCLQGSNFGGRTEMISLEHFSQACQSLKTYFGVVGVFGGNPCLHPKFPELCRILREHIPFERRGLWSNNLNGHGKVSAETFNPAVSNLNVHLDRDAYEEIRRDWPQARPFGLEADSRHPPPYVAMNDLAELDEGQRWELIASCDINRDWSAMIGVFRGELRAWFCEVAGAQSILHQDDIGYPDTGIDFARETRFWEEASSRGLLSGRQAQWWEQPMETFTCQVRKHCHECGVPLRAHGELAQAKTGKEQVSKTHANLKLKKIREVEVVERLEQLGTERVGNVCHYLQNARA